MISRRALLASAAGFGGLATLATLGMSRRLAATTEGFPVTKTEAEWRALLTPDQFAVLREEATEPAGSSPLNAEKRAGLYHCAGCGNALYDAATKFESGTGWPSFYDALPGAVGTREDRKLWMMRTEVHCARCGGHQGHVFEDGPPPTGLRHCINGVALAFHPAEAV